MSQNKNCRDYYEILDKIEDSAFEITYKAKMKSTGEMRAIKILDKKEFSKNFTNFPIPLSNEIKIMEILEGENKENENTIRFFESFENEDELATVIELYNEDLEKLAKRKKTFTVEEIKGILTQLNNTFKIMEKNKIVHRDIKPCNILITYKNKEQSDFIAKLGDYRVSDFLLNGKLDLMVGTPMFMAPEISAGKKYDEKCDLWSLGIVIYYLLFNEYPYKNQNLSNILKKQLDENELKKSGNEDLDDLIRKLLILDPKERISWKQYFEHPFFVGK